MNVIFYFYLINLCYISQRWQQQQQRRCCCFSSNLHNKWMLILLCQRFWSSAGENISSDQTQYQLFADLHSISSKQKKKYYILGTCMVIIDRYIVRLENLKLNVHIVSSPPTPRKSNQHHYRHHHVCQRLLTLSSTCIYPSAQRGNYGIQSQNGSNRHSYWED